MEVVLELPAGKLEKGSTPLENGKRELLEETGLEGYSYLKIIKFIFNKNFSQIFL